MRKQIEFYNILFLAISSFSFFFSFHDYRYKSSFVFKIDFKYLLLKKIVKLFDIF